MPEETDQQNQPVRRPRLIEYLLILIVVAIAVLVILAVLGPRIGTVESGLLINI